MVSNPMTLKCATWPRKKKSSLHPQRQTERELKLLLLPHDPIDDKNIILEIRAGTGGDEAGIFAGDLFRMYSRYAESQAGKSK